MTFVVTENCIKCKYTDCVDVCPVECFHEGPDMLVIDPDECIDCALCVPECPIDAIFEEDDLSEDQLHFIEINAKLSAKWPVIEEMIPAPEDADDWNGVADKIQFIEEELNEGFEDEADISRLSNYSNCSAGDDQQDEKE